jgi:hypothetical protein
MRRDRAAAGLGSGVRRVFMRRWVPEGVRRSERIPDLNWVPLTHATDGRVVSSLAGQ